MTSRHQGRPCALISLLQCIVLLSHKVSTPAFLAMQTNEFHVGPHVRHLGSRPCHREEAAGDFPKSLWRRPTHFLLSYGDTTCQPPPECIGDMSCASSMPYFDSTSNGLSHLAMLNNSARGGEGKRSGSMDVSAQTNQREKYDRSSGRRGAQSEGVAEWVRGMRTSLGVSPS